MNRNGTKIVFKRLWIFALVWITALPITGQKLQGRFNSSPGQKLELVGFDYFEKLALAQTVSDGTGNFSLDYNGYRGMALLVESNQEKLMLILDGTDISLEGISSGQTNAVAYPQKSRNWYLNKVANAYAQKEQAYAAWRYLQELYGKEQAFPPPLQVAETIAGEMDRIVGLDKKIVELFEHDAYLKWYVPLRKLVNSMPMAAYNYPERIPAYIAQFREIDFNDSLFQNSGLLSSLIDGHYLLLENMGGPMDGIYAEMNTSTDYLLDNLKGNEDLLQKVLGHLFDYLEKRSLFKASEHLATTMLDKEECSLDDRLAYKLESYRKLKVGNIAPDFSLGTRGKLSDVENYTLLVFGASGCPYCKEDLGKLKKAYPEWKALGMEVVYYGIDTVSTEFEQAFGQNPWITYTDFKGWDSPVVKDYCVFATPTYFLLDADRKILLRPKSVEHADAWVAENIH